MEQKEKTIQKKLQTARLLFIAMTLGIVILSVQYLLCGWILYQYYALGLAVFSLLMISLIIAKIVKMDD